MTDLDTRWVDLVDPTEAELRTQLPEHIHATARAALLAPHVHDDEPRPRIESHGDYILGIFLLPVVVADEDRVFYQEIDMIATTRQLVSISKTPPGEQPFDPQPAKEACRTHEDVGMFVYHLVDTIAERYLDLVDSLDDEIDDLEDLIVDHPVRVVAIRLRELRHDVRGIRRTLAPTRDAVHKIVDNRVELDEGELFPRDVEIAFGDAYDKLLRASEGLESSRDALSGVRDYVQGKIANDQNEVMKRLTVIASLLLVPTFIVGLYGQNFRHIPELHWGFGYWWSWSLIIVTTIAQLVFFRAKRWI
ncbi:MAG TPA: magnesium transporter CorA family protein [Gaiellaceae bacterium]|nr:magnesium transporter CorA family protein [Gaiellaceae bacterium]